MSDLMQSLPIEKGIPSGKVTTLQKHFEENPQSVYHMQDNPERKGVMLNGSMIEIGSVVWQNICLTPIYHDTLFGEIRIIYHNNRNK